MELYTKIIGGRYKGKKLSLPSKDTTRGTKSILKGSFFDTLQFDIVDKIFIEAFAGSGSMGLEAISRGASFGYFLEADKDAFGILNQNIKSLNLDNCKTILGDTFQNLPLLLDGLDLQTIIYFDPPFSYRENNEEIYNKTTTLIKNINSQAIEMVAIEHQSDKIFDEQIGNYKKRKTSKFGKSSITIYDKIN